MEKYLVHLIAAILTNASLSGNGRQVPISPNVSDANQRNLNLEVWEEHRIFYAAIVQALADGKDWPAPSGIDLSGYLSQLSATGSPFAAILNSLLGAIPLPPHGQNNPVNPAPATPASPATPAAAVPNPSAAPSS